MSKEFVYKTVHVFHDDVDVENNVLDVLPELLQQYTNNKITLCLRISTEDPQEILVCSKRAETKEEEFTRHEKNRLYIMDTKNKKRSHLEKELLFIQQQLRDLDN